MCSFRNWWGFGGTGRSIFVCLYCEVGVLCKIRSFLGWEMCFLYVVWFGGCVAVECTGLSFRGEVLEFRF